MRVDVTACRVRAASEVGDLPEPDGDWLDAPVPFDLHRVLERAGRLAPVDHGLNVEAATWVEDEAWWCVLDLPAQPPLEDGERLQLVFEGLDTVVEVWVDGARRALHRNMFRPLELPLGPGARRVHLRFEAFAECPPLPELRKAQFSAGWDFAPRRPGVGVWQPASVRRERVAVLGPVGFRTVSAQERSVEVDLDVEQWSPGTLTARVAVAGVTVEVPVAQGRTTVPLVLPAAALWWTHDLGEPALHALDVALLADGVEVDRRDEQVGIRTVELDREGGAFRLLLNGVPLAVRGVNWVPCSTALGEVDPTAYAPLLHRVRDLHAQLVRVWGGGVYEPDAFYDECDRLGLLVWQDFMFACQDYRDDDPGFVDDVVQEAVHQVRRLRRHPSVALWCGNNEVELLARLLGSQPEQPADHLFSTVLRDVVARESPGTPYTTSSPCSANSRDDGDRHTWEVWHGLALEDPDRTWSAWWRDAGDLDPDSAEARRFAAAARPEAYLADTTRFVSEYGLCGLPALETLAEHTDRGHLVLDDRQVTHRQRAGRLGPANKLEVLLAHTVGRPRDLAEQVALSQLLQAEGLKTGAEHYRRQWPHCGGQVVWQLDDCWPAISWSLVDVALRPKPAWFALRRAFAPVLASLRPTDDGASVWLTNNGSDDVDDVVDVVLQRFDGTVLEAWEHAAEVPAGDSVRLADLPVAQGIRTQAYLRLTSRGRGLGNRLLLAPLVDLERRPPVVRVEETATGVVLTSDALALAAHVPGDWDDDWVDLHPGVPVELRGQGSVGPATCR